MKLSSTTWNLDDIVTLNDFEPLLASTSERIEKYQEYFAGFTPQMSTKDFLAFIDFDEAVIEDIMRLGARIMLMESIDVKDKQALALKSKITQLELSWTEATMPISQWLKGKTVEGKVVLDDDNAKRLFAAAGDLEYGLNFERKIANHTLSQQVENILTNKASTGVRTVFNLYSMITSDFQFTFCPPGKKECIIDSLDELNLYTYSADAEVRTEAYRARFEQYENNIEKLFVCYEAIVKDWVYDAKTRGYNSPISMRNVANHLSDKSIETLLSVCSANTKIFQEFFIWKAKQLGKSKLAKTDFLAPLSDKAMTIELEPSIDEVLQSFNDFSPTFADFATKIITEKHIDFLPKKHKRSGAFCLSISPHITPYVLTNFAGRVQDKFTLAHELGHGVHFQYASSHRTSAMHANLPLSETASTFGEMIVFEKTLATVGDKAIKKQLLADKLMDSYASIMCQNYYTKFEIDAHAASEKDFSIEVLNKLWMENLAEQYGDSVEVEDMFKVAWSYIPHLFDRPFYCYAYSFGELLSMALYARYKTEGEGFVSKIEQILIAGGSEDPAKVLAEVGIDMEDASFWQGSFTIIEEWMKQLEAL
jgi:oligoendopeptidase F